MSNKTLMKEIKLLKKSLSETAACWLVHDLEVDEEKESINAHVQIDVNSTFNAAVDNAIKKADEIYEDAIGDMICHFQATGAEEVKDLALFLRDEVG